MADEKKGSGLSGKEPRIDSSEKPQQFTHQKKGASKKDKKEK
jgi:hypothetical protein